MHNNLVSIEQDFLDFESTQSKINSGEILVIAADEDFLSKLPTGNWIAGTIPYFITDDGGTQTKRMAFVNTVNCIRQPRFTIYDEISVHRIAQDTPDHGFTITIIPAGSKSHTEYAESAPSFPNMFNSPIIGWISGVHLDEIGSKSPKTVYGLGGISSSNQVVALHVDLPSNQVANIGIVNSFDQGTGDVLTFPETSNLIDKCFVNGNEMNFSQYITDNNINTEMPMVANYNGIGVNVSVQSTDSKVSLYAPVFHGVEYYFAKELDDYMGSFNKAISDNRNVGNSQFSVNCILNFLYSDLEGKQTGNLQGPVTFGEIAYQLLNQTAVYMTLDHT